VVLVSIISLGVKTLLFSQRGELTIAYPFDGSVFPPEIIPPNVWWEGGGSDADAWHVAVDFANGHDPIEVDVDTTLWAPSDALWETIKAESLGTEARITVSSLVTFAGIRRTLSSRTIAISTSPDSVGAPIFFRDVPLPFLFANVNLRMVKWRLGDIGSHERPPVVLEDMPSCGNCHSFSADGQTLGMDVDVANDKGAYALTAFEPTTTLSREKIFSWNDYYPVGRRVRTFGLLARVSPDGRYVIGGTKDRAVFIPRSDLEYSQLFFPVQGSLAFFDRETGTIHMLPGADDDRYVQSNGAWTPNGEEITFARSTAATLTTTPSNYIASLSMEETAEVLGGPQYVDASSEGYTRFLFDLYTVPFNNGRGGEPIPLEGASGNGKSNYFPKYSPDGKWIVFDQAESFMLLMPDSRLYIMPAEGEVEDAQRQFLESLEINPDNAESRLALAYTYAMQGEFERVIEEIGKVPRTDPMYGRALYMLGGICAEGGRFAEANEEYREVLSLGNHPPEFEAELHFALGVSLSYLDRYDEAADEFQSALRSDPTREDALVYLGNVELRMGDIEGAIRAFESALELNPSAEALRERIDELKQRVSRGGMA
jgi:hypothetical protein